MKNLINYYYNLLISETRKIDDNYILIINNIEYEFLPYTGNIQELYKNYLLAINSRRYVHEIIFNKDKQIITFWENTPYILIKKNINNNEKVDLKYIFEYDARIYEKFNFNWKNLWKEKMDYYDYQAREIGFKYKSIRESFNYYRGLSEMAISLINYINRDEIKAYLSHKRIKFKESIDSFSNPLNIIIDNRVRDLGEYLKINYINESIKLEDSLKVVDRIDLNRSEAILLLSRLIYPSYYFDAYDKIIQGKLDENKLKFYIEKNVYYETFLKHIYKLLKYKYNIPEIEWLEN